MTAALAAVATDGSSPWELAVAGLRRRRVALDADGLFSCPTCARGKLYIAPEHEKLNVRCFAGCSTATIARALRLSPELFVDELADEIRSESVVAARAKPRLAVLTADELDADVLPEALVERMLFYAQLHSLNGATKAGKSWLAKQLAVCIATGTPFLGLGARQGRVLYVSLELSAALVRDRIRRLAAHVGLPEPAIGEWFFVSAPSRGRGLELDLSTPAGRETLSATVADLGAELVVLDTIYRFLPGKDPNETGLMGHIYGQLNRLAYESGAALLALDHTKKGESLGPASQSAIGAQAKGAACAVVLELKRTAREDGGRWQLDCDSWFGSWEAPIYYERPKVGDERGDGCMRCGGVEAFTLSREKLEDLFRKFGELSEDDRPRFTSTRKLTDALKAAGYATGNEQAETIVAAIRREHSVPKGARRGWDRPIETETRGVGKTSPTEWRWRHDPKPAEGERW